MKITLLWIVLFFLSSTLCFSQHAKIQIVEGWASPEIVYGFKQLKEICVEDNINPNLIIEVKLDTTITEEGFEIQSVDKQVSVSASNPVGALYGLLQIKEQIQLGATKIEAVSESPQLPFRALKFNLPWDSYRTGEALQLHTETCRDIKYWESFLDMMAENRFNKLTLWNIHPFNYMVKLDKYPEACGFNDAEMLEWELFWKTLFGMAKERGIETYLVNWNIFVSPEFAEAHDVAKYSIDGQYFVDKGDTSELVKDYTRESVKAVIDKYPNLTGLGITLGEGMGGMLAEEREQWLLDSYIEGMRMASRKVKFIHRVPLSAGKHSGGSTSATVEQMTRQTLDTLTAVISPINIELKFNWSHAHSTPHLAKVHGGQLTDAYWNPLPENYKLAWMMRNEDFFILRWGQPDFIRQHIALNGHEYVNGYYVGSECYIPAKDYFTALPNTTYQYAFERQWMFYKNWGRLLYNPDTSDNVFEDAFDSRFPGLGKQLFKAQAEVSQVPLIIASYWNATWDFTLYSEGFTGLNNTGTQLLSLSELCSKQPMDPNYLSIAEYLSANGVQNSEKITPIQLADSIDLFCNNALKDIENIAIIDNNNLLYEISDIKTWGLLGMYFSDKLRAAVAFQSYLNSGKKELHIQAIKWLEKANNHWHQLVEITTPIYKPVPLMHYTKHRDDVYFHWSQVEKEVVEELNWLKNFK